MNILPCKSRFTYELTSKKEWIPEITFSSRYELGIIDKFKSISKAQEELLETLVFFNKRIINVDLEAEKYEVIYNEKKLRLPFTRLSRGERVLVLCLMADRTHSKVCICSETSQLDKKTTIKLIQDYGKSKYIDIVPASEMSWIILRHLKEKGEK